MRNGCIAEGDATSLTSIGAQRRFGHLRTVSVFGGSLMKRLILSAMLALAIVAGSTATAFAANSQNYTIVLPALQGDYYSSIKTVSGYRDFGVKHRYSGGYPVRFAVCNSSKQQIGSTITVYPGGTAADLTDLWYNAGASSKVVVVRMDSARLNLVRPLAEGSWVWNY